METKNTMQSLFSKKEEPKVIKIENINQLLKNIQDFEPEMEEKKREDKPDIFKPLYGNLSDQRVKDKYEKVVKFKVPTLEEIMVVKPEYLVWKGDLNSLIPVSEIETWPNFETGWVADNTPLAANLASALIAKRQLKVIDFKNSDI